jgi:hypothetical protein
MKKKKDPNLYPPGLTRKKVQDIIAYYDARRDVDLLEDADHDLLREPTAWLEVPLELVPKVRKLIQHHKKSA